MQFRLIGPVEIDSVGQVIGIGSPQQRLLAAALAVDAGRLVSVESLIDRIWDDPPTAARRTLHVLISKMRRTLEHASRREAEDVTVVRRSGGYVLQLSPDQVDLLQFRRLADDARLADGAARVTLLRTAVGLWQGEPLSGLPGDWAGRARAAWRQEYLEATVAWAHTELRAGNPAATVGTLTMLADENPLAESVSAALMQALCAVFRPADALARYARARRQLADELGVDPGAELQAAYQAALRDTSHPPDAITVARGPVTVSPRLPADDPAGQRTATVPRQLPTAPRLFKGRAAELASLTAAFNESAEAEPPAQIAVIHGTAGIGKTWLALHWAHRHAGDFPDGQLWIDLRGFDPSEPPLDSETALRALLDALGVAPATVPATVAAQTGLYRSVAAGRRILIVLDNARDTSQVAPLLPGSPGCRVVITSRHQLPGLVTAHAALTLNLDGFSSLEAWDLLVGHLGASRPAAEPAATAELLSYCAGLPLAISIVAAQAKAHPQFSLAALAASLADDESRLDGLDTGEPAASVRSALSWSHHALHSDTAALFLLLGLAPGPDISLSAVASLSAMEIGQARAALRELEHANLLHQHAPGRYRMHDLVALYALEQASRLPAAAQSSALRRVIDYYLHTAAAGEQLLSIPRDAVSLDPPAPGCVPGHPPDDDAALAWFRAEYLCLLAAQRTAAARGWHDTVWQLAWAMETFHKFQGNLHNWATAWRTALAAAEHLGQPAIQALTRRCLAQACFRTGQYAEALTHLSRALSLAKDAGDTLSQAHIHRMYAQAWEVQDDWRRALSHAITARRLFRRLGFPHWEADALGLAGCYHGHLGRHSSARAALHKALDMFMSHHDRHGQANAEDSLGYVALNVGDYTQAVSHYAKSLALWHHLGHSHGEADALAGLAAAYTALGDQHNATRTGRQALTLFREQRRPAEATRLQRDLLARVGPATAPPDTAKGAAPHPAVNNPLGKQHTRPADTELGSQVREGARGEGMSKAGRVPERYRCQTGDSVSGLGTLLDRPRRRRGIFFTAGIILLAAGATLSPAARADTATPPTIGVVWLVQPGGDAGQCGNPTSSTQFAQSPGWTSPIRIDTDNRAGGCYLSFGITDPSSVLTGGVNYTWLVSPGGDGGQCGNQGTWAVPIDSVFEDDFGQLILVDTDNRSGWCNLTFTVSSGSNIGLDVQFFADPSGSAGQCVNALPQGSFYTAASGAPVTIMTDTDNRPGGCWLSVRLRQFPSAAAARHAAGIHRT